MRTVFLRQPAAVRKEGRLQRRVALDHRLLQAAA
eukprot:COSAG02_NODE_43930_length_370_cov_0.940959_1_plen_33_part_01